MNPTNLMEFKKEEVFKKYQIPEMSAVEVEIYNLFKQKSEFWVELINLKKGNKLKRCRITFDVNLSGNLSGANVDKFY